MNKVSSGTRRSLITPSTVRVNRKRPVRSSASRSGSCSRSDSLTTCSSATRPVLVSIAPYISGLGFYSDDWAFIGAYATASTQSVSGYFAASHSPHHAMRPVQLLLSAVLYDRFDLAPAGYHLFNAVLVVLNPLLCYRVLRELRVPRVAALAAAIRPAAVRALSFPQKN